MGIERIGAEGAQEWGERSTGEILSDAVALLRQHFKPMVLLALPFCAVELMMREASQSTLAKFREPLERGDVDPAALLQILGGMAGGFGLMFASFVIASVLMSGQIALASRAWQGQTLQPSDAFPVMLGRGGPLVVTTLMFAFVLASVILVPGTLATFVVVVAVAAGGAAGVALGVMAAFVIGGLIVVALVVVMLRWWLFAQVTVIESLWGPQAFSRSADLMARRGLPFFQSPKFRLSVVILITFAITLTLQSLFAGPRLGIAFALGWNFAEGMPPLASLPLWFIVPFGLVEVLTNSIVLPFSAALLTLFYYDLRVRYEALDLVPGSPP